ncbi:MAG: hypothetical protein ACXWBO_09140, partial [Ilumatobacteraceae bacterium]
MIQQWHQAHHEVLSTLLCARIDHAAVGSVPARHRPRFARRWCRGARAIAAQQGAKWAQTLLEVVGFIAVIAVIITFFVIVVPLVWEVLRERWRAGLVVGSVCGAIAFVLWSANSGTPDGEVAGIVFFVIGFLF